MLLLAYQYLLSGITGTTVHAKLQFSRSPSPQTPDLQISLFSPTFLSPLNIIILFYF